MIIPLPEHNANLIEEDKQILAAFSQVPAQCDCSHILGTRLGMMGDTQIVLYVLREDSFMFGRPEYRVTDRFQFCPRCGKQLIANAGSHRQEEG